MAVHIKSLRQAAGSRWQLFLQGMGAFVAGLGSSMLLLFVPAGTMHYPDGWRLIIILFVPVFLAGIVLLATRPGLLAKRLNVNEEQKEQRVVVALSGLMLMAAFVLAGLNYRFGWSSMPRWATCVAIILILAGYILYAEVMRENAFLSRTIEVQENQKVIDTGLYGVVRHPMYMSTIIIFLAMPLVLGSVISFIVCLGYIPIIQKRIRNEEQVLEEGLEGYREYKEKVRYRLIPFIW